MSPEVNEGIKAGIRAGVLTSVSVMPNMPEFKDAVRFLKKHKKIKVGLHFDITEGNSLLWPSQVSSLLREDNNFYSLPVMAIRLLFNQISLTEVELELAAQYQKLNETGLPINHIDSHHHIHLFPTLFPILLKFAQSKKVKALRCRRFSLRNLTNRINQFPNAKQMVIILLSLYNNFRFYKYKSFFSNDALFDLNWEYTLSERKLLDILTNLPEGTTGIICHPATISKQGNKKFLASRYHCLQLLLKPKVRAKILALLANDDDN